MVVVSRRVSLEEIQPLAQLFQDRVDSLQYWLISVEQDLAELRHAERAMLHLPEATQRAQVPHTSQTHDSLTGCRVDGFPDTGSPESKR